MAMRDIHQRFNSNAPIIRRIITDMVIAEKNLTKKIMDNEIVLL